MKKINFLKIIFLVVLLNILFIIPNISYALTWANVDNDALESNGGMCIGIGNGVNEYSFKITGTKYKQVRKSIFFDVEVINNDYWNKNKVYLEIGWKAKDKDGNDTNNWNGKFQINENSNGKFERIGGTNKIKLTSLGNSQSSKGKFEIMETSGTKEKFPFNDGSYIEVTIKVIAEERTTEELKEPGTSRDNPYNFKISSNINKGYATNLSQENYEIARKFSHFIFYG